MRGARWLLAAAALACGRGEPEPPARTIHLERWDGAGVPVVGDIDVTVGGFDEKSDLTTANGTVDLVCDPCMLGDGVTRLKPQNARSSSWGSEGVTVPRIDLGMVRGTMRVAGGKGDVGPTDPSGAVTVVMRGPLDRMRAVRPPR